LVSLTLLSVTTASKRKKRDDLPSSFWFDLCQKYVDGKYKSESAFLRSKDSGEKVSMQHQKTFNRALKKFRAGELNNNDSKRNRTSIYDDVKNRLIQYIELRSRLYTRDKCGLSWNLLKEKAMAFAEQLGHDTQTFRASDNFIASVLRKGNKKLVKLHGEGMDMSEEDQARNRSNFLAKLRQKMEQFDITIDRVYNADQTGLFYNKLPNRIYIEKDDDNYRGVKQMKSKDRVTLMVATSASGKKIPLYMVGKSKKPECFRLCGYKLPMAYKDQSHAWFDKDITLHWINTVLWPWHLKEHGNLHCLLLLDNCPAHINLDEDKLPDKLVILYFPPNCTSFLQPADQGMISCLKVGYKALMLKKLLAICDNDILYEEAVKAGKNARNGCRGLEYCGKAHVLDAMEICVEIWNNDGKYAKEESIKRCWRKAGLLTATEEADLENEIGRATIPTKDKVISQDDCLELCNMFTQLQFKVSGMENLPSALEDSLVSEASCTESEMMSIMNNWINIEDNPNIIEDDVMDEIEELENLSSKEGPEKVPIDTVIVCIGGSDDHQEIIKKAANFQPRVSWHDCLLSCDVIRQFLEERNMSSELIAFEALQHKLRVKQIESVSSQLSIKSFFKTK